MVHICVLCREGEVIDMKLFTLNINMNQKPWRAKMSCLVQIKEELTSAKSNHRKSVQFMRAATCPDEDTLR